MRTWSIALLGVFLGGLLPAARGEPPAGLSPEERQKLDCRLHDLQDQLAGLRSAKPDQRADAEIFAKGVAWALRYDTKLEGADVAQIRHALDRGRQRADALADGRAPWAVKRGRVIRGYVSAVDGSVQPYAVIVPASYDPARPMRLDVLLHGSSQPVGMSELRFIGRFDKGDAGGTAPTDPDYLELHPLGRVENCYRWAGETDVFEAIEAVCRNYAVDRDRIVLRGMSMGASGTWHLGLKHPDVFVALGPYCGYVDTHHFSETPLPNFVKVGPLPPYQERGLHMLDSVDYAANAGVVPVVACMGEKDVFFQAHLLMGQAMKREGLELVNLISPGTGHVIDPVTQKEQLRRIAEYTRKGIDRAPRHLRFVPWTLKYGRCHWLQVLGLKEHYARAEFEGRVVEDGRVEVKEPRNINRFALGPPLLAGPSPRLRVGDQEVSVPARKGQAAAVIGLRDGRWTYLGPADKVTLDGKRPGLQGPIDDAFTAPFLCVRGTGRAWSPAVQAWADASLKRFAYEWARYFRGDLPVKDDTEVTDADVRGRNLILFGDPGGNAWVRKVLPHLPLRWTKDELVVGGKRYAAAEHAPVLIQPNPLPGAEGRYVVLNSGHTFHEKELASLNYLLFPRLGDWAVLKVGGRVPEEEVVRAGYCDEQWRIPATPGKDE
jgi:pimeloyl-ACP methyl ester carboxylesterase